jgi:hypothetical protein
MYQGLSPQPSTAGIRRLSFGLHSRFPRCPLSGLSKEQSSSLLVESWRSRGISLEGREVTPLTRTFC